MRANIVSDRQSIISWGILIVLTLLSVYVGTVVKQPLLFISAVLVIVFFKGLQIVDVFMELKHAPKKWRLLLLSYVLLVPFIVLLIYIL